MFKNAFTLCKRLWRNILYCFGPTYSYDAFVQSFPQMPPINRSQGINDFIQQGEVDAIDLTAVSLILEDLTGTDEILEDPVVCRLYCPDCWWGSYPV